MNTLVTGGAGFIGSNLVRSLVERGDRVTVLDNLSTGDRGNLEGLGGEVDLIEGDLRDPDVVARAVEGNEVVFHHAAMPSVPRSVEDPLTSFEVNARGTLNLLMASRDAGVRRVVYAASSSAYGDTPTLPKHEGMPQNPMSPYAADKVHGENLCRVFTASYGLECVGLRYFNIFGPGQRPDSAYAAVIPRFISALMAGERPVIYGDGLQSRDFTYIANVIDANLLAAEAAKAPGHVVNIGCGDRYTLLDLLRHIAEAFGSEVAPDHQPPRLGDVRDSQADISLAKEVLGYEPRVGLAEGLAETVAWFRKTATA